MKINIEWDDLVFGVDLGFELSNLDYFNLWKDQYSIVQTSFPLVKEKILSLLPKECEAKTETIEEFFDSILGFYKRTNRDVFYSILIGMCIYDNQLVGHSPKTEVNEYLYKRAKNSINQVPDYILSDKEEFLTILSQTKYKNIEDLLMNFYVQKEDANKNTSSFAFISYSHLDSDRVLPFIHQLSKKYNVWFDDGIRFGKEWDMEIIEKLESCTVFIFIITKNSLLSQNCKDELAYVRDKKVHFINVLLENIDLPKNFIFRYGRFQMCKLFEYSTFDSCIEDLEGKSELKLCKKTQNLLPFGHYYINGKVKESIYWFIIEDTDSELLLLSKEILTVRPFQKVKTIKDVHKTSWKNCDLRTWLNNKFFLEIFNKTESERILKRYKDGCSDKIFLLDELTFYKLPIAIRKTTITEYVKKTLGCNDYYWSENDLKTTGYDTKVLCFNINPEVTEYLDVDSNYIGIRPMILIKK